MHWVYKGRWRSLLQLLYPPHCLLCGARGHAALDLCGDCAAELPCNTRCCAHCAVPLAPGGAALVCGRCLRRPPAYRRALVPFRYAPPLDHLLQRFKFGARLECGRLLGELSGAWLAQHAGKPQCIVPVPLHRSRLRERGFDQALILASEIARHTGVPVAAGLLSRNRRTAAQSTLDAARRRRNVRGAFLADAAARDLRIALLDDVLTTGATAEEAARALLRAGAAAVEVWAVARAQAANR